MSMGTRTTPVSWKVVLVCTMLIGFKNLKVLLSQLCELRRDRLAPRSLWLESSGRQPHFVEVPTLSTSNEEPFEDTLALVGSCLCNYAAASVASIAWWPFSRIDSVERDFGRLVEAKKLKL